MSRVVHFEIHAAEPERAVRFYTGLFGWEVNVSPDPQYGGYARALARGADVAGIGPKMMPGQPSASSVYFGTSDGAALAADVAAAGGTVVVPPMQIGDQGHMAVFADPTGAFFGAWQPDAMDGFHATGWGTFGWAELNSRAIDAALPFYTGLFGWGTHASPMPDGSSYVEFKVGDKSVAGATVMSAMVPAQVPNYWLVYFEVDDVDAAFARVSELGGSEMLRPVDFPGGRFAIVADPEGAAFGLLHSA
jgi:predicted enzyme related to lactoylglutathione lyase